VYEASLHCLVREAFVVCISVICLFVTSCVADAECTVTNFCDICLFIGLFVIITGPPTHTVYGGQYCFARWRLSSSVVCRSL